MSHGLAIVGHGKMGSLIERLAPEYGFEVRAKFRSSGNSHGQALTREALRGVDVAVDVKPGTLQSLKADGFPFPFDK
jgi:hypothetical protein